MRTTRQRHKSRAKEQEKRGVRNAEKKSARPAVEHYRCLRCEAVFGSSTGPEVFCLPCRNALAARSPS